MVRIGNAIIGQILGIGPYAQNIRIQGSLQVVNSLPVGIPLIGRLQRLEVALVSLLKPRTRGHIGVDLLLICRKGGCVNTRRQRNTRNDNEPFVGSFVRHFGRPR